MARLMFKSIQGFPSANSPYTEAMFRLSMLSFAMLLVVVAVGFAMPGGWSAIEVSDPAVLSAAQFAVTQKYSGANVPFTIVSAQKQVVAGMKYDLTIETKPAGASCQVEHYQVWDRFGTKSLAVNEVLADKCVAGRRLRSDIP